MLGACRLGGGGVVSRALCRAGNNGVNVKQTTQSSAAAAAWRGAGGSSRCVIKLQRQNFHYGGGSNDRAHGFSPTHKGTMHGTTILTVRKGGQVVMIGDGMVSQGSTIVKGNAKKVRRLQEGIVAGFAGSTADAFTLLERLEMKLEENSGQMTRACVDLAKAWRTDKYLRRLEAVLLVVDASNTFELTGNGDVLQPEDGVMGIGSGGEYALAAARALMDREDMTAEQVARKAMTIAADLCIYTNHNFTIEIIETAGPAVADSKDGEEKKEEAVVDDLEIIAEEGGSDKEKKEGGGGVKGKKEKGSEQDSKKKGGAVEDSK